MNEFYGWKAKKHHLRNIGFNYHLMSAIGMKRFRFDDTYEGYNIVYNLFTNNWVEFYRQYLEFKLDLDCVKREMQDGLLYIKNANDQVVPAKFTMCKQIYFEEKGMCVHQTYFVLDMI